MPATNTDNPKLQTVPEYTNSRRLCTELIRRMIRENRIPYYRFGRAVRIDPDELDRIFHRTTDREKAA